MDTWTNQMGFPLITLIREGNETLAVQERFLLTTENTNQTLRTLPKSKYNYKWYVPLTYYTDVNPNVTNIVWMNMSDGEYDDSSIIKTFSKLFLHITLIFFVSILYYDPGRM